MEATKEESPELAAQGSELRSTERTETSFTRDALPVNGMERNPLLPFAHEAVEEGFSVVPMAPQEKRPAVSRWHIYQNKSGSPPEQKSSTGFPLPNRALV